MAVYKVPQDVEADDKLLGPFNFRQFVYLLVSALLIAAAVGLAQIFPALAIIPLPPVLLLLAMALPLKKDQPMETYLAALVSFYTKPRKRIWMPGQKETTIVITAPKIVEDVRTKGLSEDEATRRLSFLADVVDTGGQAIKNPSILRDDLAAEANATVDMFDERSSFDLERTVVEDEMSRHQNALLDMQRAIAETERLRTVQNTPVKADSYPNDYQPVTTNVASNVPGNLPSVAPEVSAVENNLANPSESSIIELANNPDFSVATIAKEANRIKGKERDEVFISLH